MKILHYSIIVTSFALVLILPSTAFSQSFDTTMQNVTSHTYFKCVDSMTQNMKTKYASFDEERAKTAAINYDKFKSEVKDDKYTFRAVSQEWTNDQVKCNAALKNALVLFFVTDTLGKHRDVTVLVNPVSYEPQGIDVQYNVPTHGGVGSIVPILIDSPLKQFKSGISANNVVCKEGLQLIIKSEDGSPACVKAGDATKLAARGWALIFYRDYHMQPKLTLHSTYDGIDKETGIVTINNQTYYQTTLNYTVDNLKKDTLTQFHNVTFAFPEGVMITPGGSMTILDIQFPDGYEEIYGKSVRNSDGSGSGIGLSSLANSPNTITVLSNHLNHQAGLTMYFDKIKLLVSTDANSPNIQTQISNSSKALKLYLSTTSQVIKPRQAIGITISVNNTLSKQITLSDENSWKLDDLSTNPCTSAPYGIAIFDGFYSEQNMTQGKPLGIFNPTALCPTYTPITQSYVFQPSSGHVTLNNCTDTPSPCSSGFDMGDQFSISSFWNHGQMQPFTPGIYTIVGGDEWGHIVIEHLVVTNSTIFAGNLGSMSCPLMYGGVQIGATIKNSTGFANYYNSTQYGNTFFLHSGMQGTIKVQYNAPANAAWFQNNDTTPFNLTNGATLLYMADITSNHITTPFAVSQYHDDTGLHSQICHYNGMFAEPCNYDNKGNIPPNEIPEASDLLHSGIDTSYTPKSVMVHPNETSGFTVTISANSNAKEGIYWLSMGRSLCGPDVLTKIVILS